MMPSDDDKDKGKKSKTPDTGDSDVADAQRSSSVPAPAHGWSALKSDRRTIKRMVDRVRSQMFHR